MNEIVFKISSDDVLVRVEQPVSALFSERAEAAAKRAEAARDAAAVAAASGGVFEAPSAGIAGTTNGETFWVLSGATRAQYLNYNGEAIELTGGSADDLMFRAPELTGSLAVGDGLRSAIHTTGHQGFYNTAIGLGAMADETIGYYNTAVGVDALKQGLGFGNTAIGFSAMVNTGSATRYDNTAVGALALLNIVDGIDNVALGIKAMTGFEAGKENTALGGDALRPLINGDRNTAVGCMAGRFFGPATNSADKLSGNQNIYVGYLSCSGASNTDDEIVIGSYAVGHGSRTQTYGGATTQRTYFSGVRAAATVPNLAYDPATGEMTQANDVTDWANWSPVIADAGTGFTATDLRARWRRTGKSVEFTLSFEITATSGGNLTVTLPIPAAGPTAFAGFEDTTVGTVLAGVRTYATAPFDRFAIQHPHFVEGVSAGGRRFVVSGSYEAA